MDCTEGQIVDLQLAANLILQAIHKNSADIAQLSDAIHRNSEQISALRLAPAIERLTATDERLKWLFDYLIRCDRGLPE